MNIVKRISLYLFILVLVIITSTLGYIFIEHANPFDALYMTIITISTVGYAEIIPLSPIGRLWTILVIIFGWGILAVIATNVFSMILSEEILGRIGRRRVRKMKDHYIICGYGRIGRATTQELLKEKKKVIVIEKDIKKAERAEKDGVKVLLGDATDEEMLKRAHIDTAKGLVAALSNDPDNIFVIINARNLNRNLFIVSRAMDERSKNFMLKAGANHVVLPYEMAGIKIANALIKPGLHDFFEIYNLRIEEIEVESGSPLAGKTIKELNLTNLYNIYIVSVIKSSGEVIAPPTAGTLIEEGDIILILGKKENIEKFEKDFLSRK